MSTLFRRAGAVLLAGALAGALLAAPAPPPPEEAEVKSRKEFIPNRNYQSLPGTTVGVLVSDVGAMMLQEGRGGPPNALAFSAGGGSYRWVYVPTPANPLISNLQVKVGEKGDKTVVYPSLNMANPDTVKQWDITTPYALVEVDVNDLRGAPADEGFVGTRMKRLDGTKDYPLLVPEVIASLRDRYAAHIKDVQKSIDDAMDDEAKAALKDRKPTGPRETADLCYVTWLPESERLRVCFRTTLTDGAYQYGGGAPPFDRPAPPFLPAKDKVDKDASPRLPPPPPPPPMRGDGARFGTTFGVEFGAAYEVSKAGKLVRVETLPIQGFQRELPPPPGAGGPLNPRDPLPRPLDK